MKTFSFRGVTAAFVAIAATAGLTLTSSGAASAATARPATVQAAVVPAQVDYENFCEDGANYCLNNWQEWFGDFSDGTGSIKMEGLSTSNENFEEQYVTRCGQSDTVTHDCPFTNTAFDTQYHGFPIVQLANLASVPDSNTCVATDGNGYATLGWCNGPGTGTGGSIGTLFVDHNGYMINVYWSNAGAGSGSATCMSGSFANGATVYLDIPTGNGCPTWSPVIQ